MEFVETKTTRARVLLNWTRSAAKAQTVNQSLTRTGWTHTKIQRVIGGLSALRSPNVPPNTLTTTAQRLSNLLGYKISPNDIAILSATAFLPPFRFSDLSRSKRPVLPSLLPFLAQFAKIDRANAVDRCTQPYGTWANYVGTEPQAPPVVDSSKWSHLPPSESQSLPVITASPIPRRRELPSLLPHLPSCLGTSQVSENGPPYAPAQQPKISSLPPTTTDDSAQASTPQNDKVSISETAYPVSAMPPPPQQAAPTSGSGFRCLHIGCKVAPFQNQYLLK